MINAQGLNRRRFLQSSAALGFGLTSLSTRSFSEESSRPPNIVFFVADDMRWDVTGYAGNKIIQTPSLDQMAAQSVVFTNAFVTTAICCTSRASFLTGRYASPFDLHRFDKPLPEDIWHESYPYLLRQHGYRTGFIGKWGLGDPMPVADYDYWDGFPGQGQYFEEVDGVRMHRERLIENSALKFLDGSPKDQPFCLAVSFKAPHVQDENERPFLPDPMYDDLYLNDTIPTPKTATDDHFKRLPDFLQNSEGRRRWQNRFANPDLFQRSVKDYYRLVTGLDRAVGAVRARLAEKDLASNTVVIFTSDNGFFLGEHGQAGKWIMNEESIRVPLVIHDPRLPSDLQGKRVDQQVLNIDMAPTMLDIAGIEQPARMEGHSLSPLMQGEIPANWRNKWFYEHLFKHPGIPPIEGVREERWKYVRFIDRNPIYEQLFDLEKEPFEETNLATSPDHQGELERLRAEWAHLRERVGKVG